MASGESSQTRPAQQSLEHVWASALHVGGGGGGGVFFFFFFFFFLFFLASASSNWVMPRPVSAASPNVALRRERPRANILVMASNRSLSTAPPFSAAGSVATAALTQIRVLPPGWTGRGNHGGYGNSMVERLPLVMGKIP
jgi:hypothetical protein